MRSLSVGTRFFEKDPANAQKAIERLERFLRAAAGVAETVYVAVNSAQDMSDALGRIPQFRIPGVTALNVNPWGRFIPALNVISYQADMDRADCLLLASVEVPPSPEIVSALMAHMAKDVLVVGARMPEHEFIEGVQVGTGLRTPWNTMALWNLHLLEPGGFHGAGEAEFNPAMAGVEEVAAIAHWQSRFPNFEALLVEIPGLPALDTEGWTEERWEDHRRKMASKNERPAAQLAHYGMAAPAIIHLRG